MRVDNRQPGLHPELEDASLFPAAIYVRVGWHNVAAPRWGGSRYRDRGHIVVERRTCSKRFESRRTRAITRTILRTNNSQNLACIDPARSRALYFRAESTHARFYAYLGCSDSKPCPRCAVQSADGRSPSRVVKGREKQVGKEPIVEGDETARVKDPKLETEREEIQRRHGVCRWRTRRVALIELRAVKWSRPLPTAMTLRQRACKLPQRTAYNAVVERFVPSTCWCVGISISTSIGNCASGSFAGAARNHLRIIGHL